jgi:predicted  nucleic acid-binding Zn-ribbon protein
MVQRKSFPAVLQYVCDLQVMRLEVELRQARQAGDAAETKATAAAKDLRQLSSLEDEVRRLRSQAIANEKRRTKDAKSLKDAELRASTLDSRLSERDSQVEAMQKQLAAVRTPLLPF